MNNKGQMQAGLVTGLVFGVASLIIAVVIAFVIVSTLIDSELIERTTRTVTNETVHINSTTDTLIGAAATGLVSGSFSITDAYNKTSGIPIVVSGNITVSSAGVITNASSTSWLNATVSYTYKTKAREELSSIALSTNFTEGVDNVSKKIPTVLLVAAIVLILGVLAILVGIWQKMRMGGTSL